MEIKQAQKLIIGNKLSDESFITLFMIGVLIVLFGLACLVVPNFYLPKNILNLITNNWFIIILGIGVTFVLITGNYDMSVGANIALDRRVVCLFLPGGQCLTEYAGQWPGTALRRGGGAGAAVRHGCWRS
jgi:Ribose/xylose/arabinose/galactoside ABC-type transport systems, permease components